jgi:hypothetical protein
MNISRVMYGMTCTQDINLRLGWLFVPEEGGIIPLRNVCIHLIYLAVSHDHDPNKIKFPNEDYNFLDCNAL